MRLNKKSIFVLFAIGVLLMGIAVYGLFFLIQEPQGKFGIYLSDKDQPVISGKDIVWYNKSSHEMKLTEEGLGKLEALAVSVYGTPFVIKLNGIEIYNGSFWTPISSISFHGIVIEIFRDQNTILKIQKGYPSSGFFVGTDPRDNSEVLDYFQRIGKLIQ